jgi:Protein of unknown function (DUF3151)
MTEIPVNEPLETRMEEPEGSMQALESTPGRLGAMEVARRWPSCLAAWATLGEHALEAGNDVGAYAYFRVGYHRGLDRLRASGWRGMGTVPWSHPGNRGFLRSLQGLAVTAEVIGEADEAERCRNFVVQLAPDAPS